MKRIVRFFRHVIRQYLDGSAAIVDGVVLIEVYLAGELVWRKQYGIERRTKSGLTGEEPLELKSID